MTAAIDYYFSPVSPWSYLGHERFRALARRFGAAIRYKPADFGKIFAASGGLPVAQRPKQRQAYRLVELERWRDFLGLPLTLQPKHFPVPAELAARLIIAAERQERDPGDIAAALMRACWAEERDISDAATLQEIADRAGFDGAALLAAAQGAEAQDDYARNTAEAIERQVFGAPTYLLDGEIFWGQDRLDFLERKLARRQNG
jgi:2-hydroxychromene-2-carboxylate isomerase